MAYQSRFLCAPGDLRVKFFTIQVVLVRRIRRSLAKMHTEPVETLVTLADEIQLVRCSQKGGSRQWVVVAERCLR